MTQCCEERVFSLEYTREIEREELESFDSEESQINPINNEKPSRSSRTLEKLTKKAEFNNRYFETSFTLEKNKREAILKANGYFKF